MNRHAIVLSISLAVVGVIASSFASRSALGLVIEACKINSALTGSPYPCLKVVEMKDALSSYAILREPDYRQRTILAPLADVPGIEDPRLLQAGAPNYFDDAWKERLAAISLSAERGPSQDFALAINAATWRTQDHLHIHMGCATPRLRGLLNSHEIDISSAKFTNLKDSAGWWARFYSVEDLSNLNPLKVVAEGVDGARANMQNVVVGVFRSTGRQNGFYVLARITGANKARGSAEDLIDPKCL